MGKQARGSSPGVIARLMGLDTLPSPGTLKPQEVKRCFNSSKELRENFTALEDYLLPNGIDKHQKFKDVFEVMEARKVEMHKSHKGIQTSLKHSELDSSIVCCGFIDEKYLSTYKKFRSNSDVDDKLDVLDSDKDLFQKFLHEPSSLFSKHLHDLTHSPTAPFAIHASNSTSKRSSSTASCESSSRSERYVEKCTHLQRADSESFRKIASARNRHPFCEHSCYIPERLSYSTYEAKDERCGQSADIVILKPGLGKAHKSERTTPSAKSCQFGNINHREFPIENLGQYREEIVRKKIYGTRDSIGYRAKGSKQNRNSSNSGRNAFLSKFGNYATNVGLGTNSSNAKGYNSQFSSLNPDNLYEYGLSSEHESLVNREANRLLPEQWKLTPQFQEISLSSRASNSLGEILALSDKGTFGKTGDSSNVKKSSPMGISSKGLWKDGFSMSFPRSKSLPTSSLAYEICQSDSRNRLYCSTMVRNAHDNNNGSCSGEESIWQTKASSGKRRCHHDKGKVHSDVDENETPDLVIHVTLEEQKNKHDAGNVAGKQHIAIKVDSEAVENFSPLQFDTDKDFKKFQEFMKSEENGKHLGSNLNALLSKETSGGYDAEEHFPSQFNKSPSASPQCSREADQPSPVSVLELPSEEKSKSGCFEKISATLQELRMQLHLLKLESTEYSAEEIGAFISSDEDEDSSHLRDIIHALKDEDDRDYSYLIDMLIDSQIPYSKDWLFTECNSIKLPVGLYVFNNLEKKYKLVGSWSKSERKLLFDLINSTLAEIIKSSRNMRPCLRLGVSWQPKMVNEDLVEEIWQKVAKGRKEMSNNSEVNFMGSSLLDLGDDIDHAGIELENMLIDDLMNELAIQLRNL